MKVKVIALLAVAVVLALAPAASADEKTLLIRKVMKKARPATAAVTFNIQTDYDKKSGSAWGVVVSADGLVMIPASAISDKYSADKFIDFKVHLELDKPKKLDAEYLGKDVSSGAAMLKIKQEEGKKEKFEFVRFDDKARLGVADEVVVVGHMGEGFNYKRDYRLARVTAALENPIRQYALTPDAKKQEFAVIYTLGGTAVGVLKTVKPPEKKRRQSGFIIMWGAPSAKKEPALMVYPSEHFSKVIDNPPKPEKAREKVWLGLMGLQNLSKPLAEYWGMKKEKGVIIGHVVPGGPGEKIGFKTADVIVEMNGLPLESDLGDAITALKENLKKLTPEDKVEFSVFRKGSEVKLSGNPEHAPKTAAMAKKVKFDEVFKFGVRELVFEELYDRDLPMDTKGVFVHYLKSGWARDAGLEFGDIVTRINDVQVDDVDHFKTLFDNARKSKPREIIFEVMRGKNNQVMVLRIECHWKK